jgi:hypothetical protein
VKKSKEQKKKWLERAEQMQFLNRFELFGKHKKGNVSYQLNDCQSLRVADKIIKLSRLTAVLELVVVFKVVAVVVELVATVGAPVPGK